MKKNSKVKLRDNLLVSNFFCEDMNKWSLWSFRGVSLNEPEFPTIIEELWFVVRSYSFGLWLNGVSDNYGCFDCCSVIPGFHPIIWGGDTLYRLSEGSWLIWLVFVEWLLEYCLLNNLELGVEETDLVVRLIQWKSDFLKS